LIAQQDKVIIIKMNTDRKETWRYEGRIIDRDTHRLLIEAFFNIDEISFQGITLRRNDRSIECFYDDRWYNVFEIHDREDDRLKAWYCNVTTPAEFSPGRVTYIDLALDVLVYPNGEYLILDEDEFQKLTLDSRSRIMAHRALNKIIQIVESGGLADLSK